MSEFIVGPPSRQVGVSNTEAQLGYKCGLAWLYGFHPELNFQLIKMGEARTRGILGHKALEIFYLALKDGVDYDDAAQMALDYIQELRVKELFAGDFADLDLLKILNYLHEILEKYFELYRSDAEDFEILGVESFYAMEWEGENDFYLPIRLDLAVYYKRGPWRGETVPIDTKFTYDFWPLVKFKLNSQLPLQIRALRDTRFPGKPEPVVRRALINQIRTRSLKNPSTEDLFLRKDWEYNTQRVENVFRNHLKSAVKLAWLKRLPLGEAREEVSAALGSDACKFCDFKEVCDNEFEGNDPTMVIAATLKRNEYGYPPLEEIRGGQD